MNSEKPINILYKKEINEIEKILLKARDFLIEDNIFMKNTPQDQIVRMVLFGCLCIEIKNINGNTTYKSLKNFEQLINYVDTNLESEGFSEHYLNFPKLKVRSICFFRVLEELEKITKHFNWQLLIIYAFEILNYSNTDLMYASRDRRNGVITKKKKDCGIYYTPLDIVNYMVRCCSKRLLNHYPSLSKCRFVDFSCGSGVFLLQILNNIIESENISTFTNCNKIIEKCLFGVDVSTSAVECARYCVLSNCIRQLEFSRDDVVQLIDILNSNIICADAIEFNANSNLKTPFPKNFHCIIGNPPYVGNSEIVKHIGTNNLFIPFVKNLISFSNETSVSSLVLPLSVSYNNQPYFRELRKSIEEDTAEWKFEHYDRSPDSLFGDDVKSRSCILFREQNKESKKMLTTQLLRWTSSLRTDFFYKEKECVDITNLTIDEFIPKISTLTEKNAYQKIQSYGTSLLSMMNNVKPESTDNQIIIKGTAYNCICAYDHIPFAYDEYGNRYIANDIKVYSPKNINDQYFILSILNSRIVFWLWTVIGDGFHVTNRLLERMKISEDCFTENQLETLKELGKDFSDRIKNHSSTVKNGGKTITVYNHFSLTDIVAQIDKIIISALDLPEDFLAFLEEWHTNLVVCGRRGFSNTNN